MRRFAALVIVVASIFFNFAQAGVSLTINLQGALQTSEDAPIPVLTKAMQEHQEVIRSQQEQIEELRAMIKSRLPEK